MTKLNNTTKKAKSFVKAYNASDCLSVRDFYKTCSSEKISAEREIKDKIENIGGFGYRVLRGNTFTFTCGYVLGNSLIVETVANTFKIENFRKVIY